jgi:hypothetical protein
MIEAYFLGPRIFGANYRELKKGEKRERRRLGGILVSFLSLALFSLFQIRVNSRLKFAAKKSWQKKSWH